MTNIQVLLKHNIVIAELVFLDHDFTTIFNTISKFDYDQIIDATTKQIHLGGLGSAWNGTSFVTKPYPSWTLDSTFTWQPPTPKPNGDYNWDETKQTWVVATNPDNESGCIDCDKLKEENI